MLYFHLIYLSYVGGGALIITFLKLLSLTFWTPDIIWDRATQHCNYIYKFIYLSLISCHIYSLFSTITYFYILHIFYNYIFLIFIIIYCVQCQWPEPFLNQVLQLWKNPVFHWDKKARIIFIILPGNFISSGAKQPSIHLIFW